MHGYLVLELAVFSAVIGYEEVSALIENIPKQSLHNLLCFLWWELREIRVLGADHFFGTFTLPVLFVHSFESIKFIVEQNVIKNSLLEVIGYNFILFFKVVNPGVKRLHKYLKASLHFIVIHKLIIESSHHISKEGDSDQHY